MIACRSEETVLRALVEAVPSVWVANHNAADQTVLAGTTDGLATAGALLTAAEVAHKVLNVSHAFHSPLLEPANQAIVGLVNGLALEDPKTAFISCISASAYSNAEEIRSAGASTLSHRCGSPMHSALCAIPRPYSFRSAPGMLC